MKVDSGQAAANAAQNAGYRARQAGRAATANPHRQGTKLHDYWASGWEIADGHITYDHIEGTRP